MFRVEISYNKKYNCQAVEHENTATTRHSNERAALEPTNLEVKQDHK